MTQRGSTASCIVLIAACLAAAPPGCTQPSSEEDAGDTADVVCAVGETSCDGATFRRCGAGGTAWEVVETCEGSCDDESGCGPCDPGSHRCSGSVSRACLEGGVWEVVRDCAEWESACGEDGFCADACAVPEREGDHLGCDYLAVAMPRPPPGDPVVVVANPNDEAVHVRMHRGRILLDTLDIEPRWSRSFTLPRGATDATGVDSEAVVRIRSDRPVTATQFAPFESGGTWSADASLLLPIHSLGRRHRIASYLPLSYVGVGVMPDERHWAARDHLANARGFLTVVGWPHARTRVTVVPTAPLAPDPSRRVPATAAGGTLEVDLEPGEALHLFAAQHPICSGARPGFEALGVICWDLETGGACGEEICRCRDDAACAEPAYDLTGTRVESDHPVAVFGAHECAFVPHDRWACDHLQEQLPPMETWGMEHVGMTVGADGGGGPNVLRILAGDEATVVTIEPPQSGIDRLELEAGGWAEVTADGIFRVAGDQPVMVAQYLYGQGIFLGPGLRGDPSLWVVPPVEQFRDRYEINLPESYEPMYQGQNFLLVVRPRGTWTANDRVRLPDFADRVGGWEAGVVQAGPGVRSIVGEREFGLTAIGLSEFTSYATPAGRGLLPLLL